MTHVTLRAGAGPRPPREVRCVVVPRLTGLPRATAARARAVPVLLASPLFDEAWYAA